MDLDTLLLLILFLAPVLSRLFRGKKPAGKVQPPRQVPAQTTRTEKQMTPFEEALRQIQEALAERGTEPPPQRRVETAPKRERRTVPAAPLPRMETEFRSREQAEKARFFDDAFEAAAPYQAPGADEHYHEPLGTPSPLPDIKRPTTRRKGSAKWRQAMKNVVILNPPRSRTGWTPPGA